MTTSIVKILRVVADPNRLRILLLLKAEELSVAELQEILVMGQSTISTHLSQLKTAGLVEDRRSHLDERLALLGRTALAAPHTTPDFLADWLLREMASVDLELKDGTLATTTGPGWGFAPDTDFLKRF